MLLEFMVIKIVMFYKVVYQFDKKKVNIQFCCVLLFLFNLPFVIYTFETPTQYNITANVGNSCYSLSFKFKSVDFFNNQFHRTPWALVPRAICESATE